MKVTVMRDAPWILGKTIDAAWSHAAQQWPEHEALVFPRLGVRWTYGELGERVRAVARALVASGIEPGDHVGIWSTNWPEWVLLQLATASAGGVLVNINPSYRANEFSFVLKAADIQLLFLTDHFRDLDYEAMLAECVPELANRQGDAAVCSNTYPRLRQVVSIKKAPTRAGIWSWEAFLERGTMVRDADLDARRAAIRPNEAVNIQFTSGTTGSPKGAMLSHRNLLYNAYHVGARMRIRPADRLALPVPFYHCFGCVMGTLMCVVHGATMVVPAESFDPLATLEAVAGERCTALYGVPTMFNAELHARGFDSFDLTSLRTGIMAGSPCPIELMRQVADRMHASEITIAYGLTEASPVITQTETSEPLEVRVQTVGMPLPGVEVRLVDPVTKQDSPDGMPGELWARGHGIMLGYYRQPEATALVIDSEGWLHTGDLATRLPSGHFKITGRIKDMIIRGGENVYPREIEDVLLGHPAIRDAQIVGLPDRRYGEEVSAWIIPKTPGGISEDEVRQYCRERLARYKVPRYVAFVEEYPLTVSGKVQKYRLRELGIARFGLEDAARTATA